MYKFQDKTRNFNIFQETIPREKVETNSRLDDILVT